MEISYPIFIKDRDGWMGVLNVFKEIQTKLEKIDIEDREYTAWDANGIPLEFYIDQEEIKVRIASNVPRIDGLRKAILNYVALTRPKVPFVYSGSENNMVKLFKVAEEHIKKNSLIQKIKNLFRS